MSDDEERPLQAFLGCAFQFLAMALVSWLFLLGTALLIFQRWCKP